MKNKKVLMIWTTNNRNELGGVGYYRIVNPAREFVKNGYDVTVMSSSDFDKKFKLKDTDTVEEMYSRMFEQYDLVWMKHTDNISILAKIFELRDKYKKKLVWDFDDDLFNVRPSQPAYEKLHPQSPTRIITGASISMCDALTVSTPYLKKSLSKLLKEAFNIKIPIYVCPNFVNKEEWNNVKYRPSNSPVIGYYGSITHNDDFALIKKVIYKILKKYNTVRFQVVGAFSSETMIGLFSDVEDIEILKQIELIGGTNGWNGFPELLLRQNWDISVAPLIDDEFNRSKSNIKWMESSMKSIPTVCSNVEPYKMSVTKNTGFLCNTEKEWFNTLVKLIENKDLRVKIGKQAKEYVLSEFTDKAVKDWIKTLDILLK